MNLQEYWTTDHLERGKGERVRMLTVITFEVTYRTAWHQPWWLHWSESQSGRFLTLGAFQQMGALKGLLMRPEHSEIKAKTETRQCETEIETETKNLLWDRDQKLRDRDQSSQVNCRWK